VRLVFFPGGLAALGVTYTLTGSEELQVVAMFALIFGVLPGVSRRFDRHDEYTEAVQDRNAPFSVLAFSVTFAVSWGLLVFLIPPELGLGPWFWWWAVVWPWLEVHLYLGERHLRRGGGEAWKPARPLRDSALAGVATAGAIVVITLLQDATLSEALATAAACGAIVFTITGTFTWLSLRAQQGQHDEAASSERGPAADRR